MEARIDESSTSQAAAWDLGQLPYTDSAIKERDDAGPPTLFPDIRGMEQRTFWKKRTPGQTT